LSDFTVRLEEARKQLPLRQLMEQRGRGPGNGHWRAFPKCPYCGKDGAGLFILASGGEMFKCHHAHCPSGTAEKGGAWDEVAFLRHELGLTRKEAAITFLKEAGVWKEREAYAPSVMPGKAGRKIPPPSEQGPPEPTPPALSDGTGAPGVEGEAGLGSRTDLAPPASVVPGEIPGGLAVNGQSAPGSGFPGPGAGGAETPGQLTHEAEPGGAETLPSSPVPQGEGAPSGGGAPGSSFPAGTPGSSPVEANPPASSLCPTPNLSASESSPGSSSSPPSAPPSKPTPTTGPTTKPAAKVEEEAQPELPPGTRALREFVSRLTLTPADAEKLWRRGLEWPTVSGMGLRSNPRANKEILIELEAALGYDEMAAAGLWTVTTKGKAKRERRPSAQFCGAGIVRKLRAGERAGKGEWADDKDNLWAWCEPILIPYFDENYDLIGLRPHKGGGQSGTLVGTPRPFIPRSLDLPAPEFYSTVIITEGEYKAMALWRQLGPGRKDGLPPWGVASLPGITFGRNEPLRTALDRWLRAVKCNRVMIAFDSEEKGDPNLESYKPEREKRFEVNKWAKYLGMDLHRKLHVRSEICTIPAEWRNAKGKADWDGVAAMVLHEGR